jgi:hypothetical protein
MLTIDISIDIVDDRSNAISISKEEFLKYVRKMRKLVAGRRGNPIYGWKFSMESWGSLGPILWAGRNPAGAAFDVREWAEARL